MRLINVALPSQSFLVRRSPNSFITAEQTSRKGVIEGQWSVQKRDCSVDRSWQSDFGFKLGFKMNGSVTPVWVRQQKWWLPRLTELWFHEFGVEAISTNHIVCWRRNCVIDSYQYHSKNNNNNYYYYYYYFYYYSYYFFMLKICIMGNSISACNKYCHGIVFLNTLDYWMAITNFDTLL